MQTVCVAPLSSTPPPEFVKPLFPGLASLQTNVSSVSLVGLLAQLG